MTDLCIRITESDGIRYATGVNPYASTLYIGENIPDTLDAILDALQDYARAEPTAMVRALSFNAEFCQLAAAVHGLHLAESDATPAAEAIAILTKLRDSRQPEAIRTRAGNLLIDIAEDDRAVCDASSVDYSKDYPEIGDFRRDCGTCAAYQDKGRERLQCDDCETDAQQKWSPCEAVRNAKRDASSVDAVDPIRDNIAGTRVRYLGDLKEIKGCCGVLTGDKKIDEHLGEVRGIVINGERWAIPFACPLEVTP